MHTRKTVNYASALDTLKTTPDVYVVMSERVKRGIRWLDAARPDWRAKFENAKPWRTQGTVLLWVDVLGETLDHWHLWDIKGHEWMRLHGFIPDWFEMHGPAYESGELSAVWWEMLSMAGVKA